jgi:hypothetical protein
MASLVMGDAHVQAAAERLLEARAGTRAPKALSRVGVN